MKRLPADPNYADRGNTLDLDQWRRFCGVLVANGDILAFAWPDEPYEPDCLKRRMEWADDGGYVPEAVR